MKRIVIFASGSGTNTENIIKYFNKNKTVKVTKVLCNNKNAKVFDRCKRLNISCLHFNRKEFINTSDILTTLKQNADYVVLAGFLWKIPKQIIDAFPKKIINIHPSLLPKYGGKGMYGINVHKEVKKNNEKETGITVHYVNENYDEGDIIFQSKTLLSADDTPKKIANKVGLLEYRYFPIVIENIILSNK